MGFGKFSVSPLATGCYGPAEPDPGVMVRQLSRLFLAQNMAEPAIADKSGK